MPKLLIEVKCGKEKCGPCRELECKQMRHKWCQLFRQTAWDGKRVNACIRAESRAGKREAK